MNYTYEYFKANLGKEVEYNGAIHKIIMKKPGDYRFQYVKELPAKKVAKVEKDEE